jgi:formylglycine-generating enzyme required for sulfatase activity
MANIPPEIYDRLYNALLKSDGFASESQLRTYFDDNRISAWRATLKETRSPDARVREVITHLSERHSAQGDNGLVLFLRVLADQTPVNDAQHRELAQLAADLERALPGGQQIPKEPRRRLWSAVIAVVLIIVVVLGWGVSQIVDGVWSPWLPLTTKPTSFTYQVRVLEEGTLNAIQGAEVRIMTKGGIAPETATTDSTGLAILEIDATQAGQLGMLMVEAPGYEGYEAGEYINLTEGALPKSVYLKPMGEGPTDEELTMADTPEPPPTHTPRPGPTATNTPLPPSSTPEPTPTDTPTAIRAVNTRVSLQDGAVMVYVPAGEFQMGSAEGGSEEQPVHLVALDAFWLYQTEVSVGQFRDFVMAEGYETEVEQQGQGFAAWVNGGWEKVIGADWQHPRGPDSRAQGDHPVVQVSWGDAMAYCDWAGGRLPTEAEWAYAARGSEGQIYPWGNVFNGRLVNFCDVNCEFGWADSEFDDGYAITAPVGSFPDGASWVGALDMAGNVWEWVVDWYGPYPSGRQENPTGPGAGESRVLRGGAWLDPQRRVRSAGRLAFKPEDGAYDVGFRCAVTAR